MLYDPDLSIVMWISLGRGLWIVGHDHEKSLKKILTVLGHKCKMAMSLQLWSRVQSLIRTKPKFALFLCNKTLQFIILT